MPPKFDPFEKKVICFRVFGGLACHPAALAPKCGPLGISPQKMVAEIATATKDWKGMRLWVEMTVVNRVATVRARPTTSNHIIQALQPPSEVASRHVRTFKVREQSLSLQSVIEISRKVRSRSMARTFEGTVKEVLGTCLVIGCQVDHQDPRVITKRIQEGELTLPSE